MNYLIPVTKLNNLYNKSNIQYMKEDLDTILTQEVLITYLSNGISYNDIESMDEYERIYIFNKLIQLKKEENEAKQEAINKLNNK